MFASAPAPREVAGGPVGGDILKCQLTPIEPADYGVTYTTDEQAQLERIFATGVCDW